MAITVKHKFVSAIPDAGDTTIVQPSNWNDDHDLVGTVPVANGGTGATTLTGYVKGTGITAMTAATTIPNTDITGLGTMSTQNANAVAITGGTITGVTVSGYIPYTGAGSAIDLNAQTVTNIAHLGLNSTAVPDILFRAYGDNNATSRISIRGYSSNASSSSMRIAKFRGTYAAPQAPLSGDSLGKFELAGYGTTSANGYPQVSYEGVTTEAWTAIARGAKALFYVTPNTTTTQAVALTLDQDKTATFASTVTATTFSGSGASLTSIPNSALVNSAITINGTSTSLGGSISVGTVTSVTGTSPVVSSGGATPAISMAAANTTTNGYLTSTDWNTFNGKGSGSVTAVSVTSANGFAGTSSGGATPALTLSTSVTGVLKGNATAISAATAGTDYSAGTSALTTGILKSTTTTGALSIAVAADFPTLNQNTTGTAGNVTGIVLGANGGTGVANTGSTITIAGNLTHAGAFTQSFTATGNTAVTLPTSGYLISTVTNMAANPVTGTPSASNFLRGDGTWASPTAGLATYTRTNFTATAGQTSFTVAYTVGYVEVFVNGVLLDTTDYTSTSGTAIVLATAAALNDIVTVIAYNTTTATTAAGSDTQVQYNSGGNFAGSANLTFNGTTLTAGGLAGPFNGTVGATTPATGLFTTLGANASVTTSGNKGAIYYGTLGYSDTNILASYQSSVAGYNQVVLQNTNAGTTSSTNFNISNDAGTATTNYGEFGINSSGFTGSGAFNTAGSVYLTSASTDLAIGTYGANPIHFVVNSGATDAMTISSAGVVSLGTALALGSGGTGSTTAAGANANLQAYTTTATAAGTTTLTNTSTYYQYFTGTSAQTVRMPVTSTLQTGWSFHIANNSTVAITLQSSGANTIGTIPPQTTAHITCIGTALTTAADWDFGYTDFGTLLGNDGAVPMSAQWYLSSAGGTLSGTAQNFFGANSAVSLDASSTYDIECYCYFLKTTAGTVQWIPTVGSAFTVGHSYLEYTPVTGFTTTLITGTMVTSEATGQTLTALTHTATASLSSAVYHIAKLRIRITTNAATNFRLNNTIGTGSITPQAGSWYTARKIATNSGTFVA